jgi:hypothetical protein
MRLTLDARTAAFGGLIDYAGLFPPASLTMTEAVETYRRARLADTRWVPGRFLCRASHLEELAAVGTAGLRRHDDPWQIGMIVDMGPGAAAAVGRDFHSEMAPAMTITAAEAKLAGPAVVDAGSLLDALATIDTDLAVYIEIDAGEQIVDQLHEVRAAVHDRGDRGGAKLRCGGLTAAEFPSVETVASFIWEASLLSLPFKATAGLHQPVRHHDEELDVWRHGFVNLLMASAACDNGEDRDTIEAIVAETDPAAFTVTPVAATWRHVTLPGSAIRRARRSGLVAYGSCDLAEPLEALDALGFLGSGS